jgi:hypothetical protein
MVEVQPFPCAEPAGTAFHSPRIGAAPAGVIFSERFYCFFHTVIYLKIFRIDRYRQSKDNIIKGLSLMMAGIWLPKRYAS